MHELALCEAVYRIVERARERTPEPEVEVLEVEVTVGRLRQVVPGTLAHCWEMVTARTPLAGSILQVQDVPVTVECPGCGAVGPPADPQVLACATCGSARVRVLTGEEFRVTALQVADG